MKNHLLIIISLLSSCSTTLKTFTKPSDIEHIKSLKKVELRQYLIANSPKFMEQRICQNVFEESYLNTAVTKSEALICMSQLVSDFNIQNVRIPFSDIPTGSVISNYIYFFGIHNIITPNSPYVFGANENFSGHQLIHAVEKINKIKK